MANYPYPRVRDLPEEHRGPFRLWLAGQTQPFISGVAWVDQDFFYQWDYDRWKEGRAVFD